MARPTEESPEVTSEMIEAGDEVLYELAYESWALIPQKSTKDLLTALYRPMTEKRPSDRAT